MASTYPYTNSVAGLVSTLEQLRKVFPPSVTTATVAQWGFAPNNERYVIGVLKHLKIIDEDGKKSSHASRVFLLHKDDAFQAEFSKIVREAYPKLFEIRGDDAWACDQDTLITFFRQAAESSATVGRRQARTFQALAGIAGKQHTARPASSAESTPRKPKARSRKKPPAPTKPSAPAVPEVPQPTEARRVGLTVRIELNLPATTDQRVYDGIFKSVRKHLIDE